MRRIHACGSFMTAQQRPSSFRGFLHSFPFNTEKVMSCISKLGKLALRSVVVQSHGRESNEASIVLFQLPSRTPSGLMKTHL